MSHAQPNVLEPPDLDKKVILITGAAGDIGSSIVIRCARLGAKIVMVDNGTSVDGYGDDPSVIEKLADKVCKRIRLGS